MNNNIGEKQTVILPELGKFFKTKNITIKETKSVVRQKTNQVKEKKKKFYGWALYIFPFNCL